MTYNWSKLSQVEPKFTVFFDHNAEYDATEFALKKIKSGQNGSSILRALTSGMTKDNALTIMVDIHSDSEAGGELTLSQSKKYSLNLGDDGYVDKVIHLVKNNIPVKPVIYYNPINSVVSDRHNRSYLIRNEETAFISLAHEMIHAFHLMRGTSKSEGIDRTHDSTSTQLEEEERAVGIGKYHGALFSENGVREDHGIRLRASYFTQDLTK